MRKIVVLGLMVLGLLCLTGCKKDQTGKAGLESLVVTEEDYQQGNLSTWMLIPMMKTEKGHYYYSETHQGFRYYDIATGTDMYLCNKPECRHDGSDFCVATNKKYRWERFGMYNGRLYAAGVEETESQYLYKLLTIAPDGSEMSEVLTYLTVAKMGQQPEDNQWKAGLYMHRNKAMIPIEVQSEDGLEESKSYGTAIVDLDTKEVTYLDETPLSKENIPVKNISAFGDYFYYYRREGKKNVLHRYNINDGSDESYKLLVGFVGEYVVLDDNTIVYLRGGKTTLCVNYHDTGENVEKVTLKKDVNGEERLEQVCCLLTDGTYLYVTHMFGWYHLEGELTKTFQEMRVFDYDLNELVKVDMVQEDVLADGEWVDWSYVTERMRLMGEEIYCELHPYIGSALAPWRHAGGVYVFKCNRSDLLQGKVDFEFVYKRE